MRHTLPIAPQFYVTAPQPCPYLDGQVERKLFTALTGEAAAGMNDALSQQGFRRSQNVAYRPSCAECAACLSARIRVADFKPTRSQRRVEKRNAYLTRRIRAPWATEEQYALFRSYLDSRHADGGMAEMDVFEFAAMIEETPVKTRVIEYMAAREEGETPEVEAERLRLGLPSPRRLIAACLTDVLEDGLSMVYSFFDPSKRADSLGAYLILDHIRLAQELDLPYVYLGYWVPGSPKMDYKSRYAPLEIYAGGRWQELTDPAAFAANPACGQPASISEQVAGIELPQLERGT
ncbi:MAG: arginyltransferase [Rhodobacterales bacterium]|nr:MAG: arginyltransferase [Rhodobacterales bacterium]